MRLATVTYAPTRILDGVKSLSYAANMLATRLAQERGFDEALMVTPHGRVLEAPTSSLFWIDAEGRILTPPLERPHPRLDHPAAIVMEIVDVEERAVHHGRPAVGAARRSWRPRRARLQSITAVDDSSCRWASARSRCSGR